MEENTRIIALTQGYYATVDASDFKSLSEWDWNANVHKRKGKVVKVYAFRVCRGQRFYMHRQITNAPVGMEVDHRDGDGLNNTRDNLRICTRSQNLGNQKSRRGVSRFIGVSLRRDGLWSAALMHKRKEVWLGAWDTEEEAARAYDSGAFFLRAEFAALNFPDSVKVVASIDDIKMAVPLRGKKSKVGFYGVYRSKNNYMATIAHNGRNVYIGHFANPIEAAMEYDRMAVGLGKRRLNFP